MNPDFWKAKRVLITGGSGFVGRWVGRVLRDTSAELHILDLVPPKGYEVPAEFHRIDLRDPQSTLKLFEQLNPHSIIHLAGLPGVQSSHDHPVQAYEANVLSTFNILEACRVHGRIGALVAVSSNHVYGEQHQMPTSEDSSLNGTGMYAVSKLCGDMLARTYGKVYQVPVGIARMANSFGPDDHHTSHIVTGTILSCLQGHRPVIRQSGRDRKGYLYIKDTAEGLLAVAEAIASSHELRGEAFNLAPDESPTVLEVVRLIMKITGISGEPEIQRCEAVAETEHLSNSKAKRLLAWNPKFALSEELKQTICWYRDHPMNAS